jgi:hypothetical protein
MSDSQDPIIRRLFTEQDQSLPSDDFMLKLSKRIDERQRVRRVYRVLAISACLVLSTVSAPWVAQITSTLIEFTAGGINSIGPLLHAPLTRLVVGATAVGCSPVIYLWRTGRW